MLKHTLASELHSKLPDFTVLDAGRDDMESKSIPEDQIRVFDTIINEFGSVMEDLDNLSDFHDLDKLPFQKEEILNAIIGTFEVTSDQNKRETLEVGLLALSQFLENVGDPPN